MRERDADSRKADFRVENSRREAEERLADLRSSLGREFGAAPRKAALLLLLAAGAAGFALALRRFRRRALRD